jgi:hypothetical protein
LDRLWKRQGRSLTWATAGFGIADAASQPDHLAQPHFSISIFYFDLEHLILFRKKRARLIKKL